MKYNQKSLYLFLSIFFLFTICACSDNKESNLGEQQEEKIKNEYGNSMVNLQNDGLIATDGENVYYNDVNGLFVNSLSGGNRRSISPDYAEQINVIGDWVYYYSTSDSGAYKGLWKVKKDGKDLTMLRDGTISNLIATSDWIYFSQKININSNAPSLVKMDVEENLVQPQHIYEGRTDHLNLEENWFYFYSSTEEGICKITVNGDNFEKIKSIKNDNFTYMVVYEKTIYYVMDNKIYSINEDGTNDKILLDLSPLEPISPYFKNFIINDNYLYFCTFDNLYRFNIKNNELNKLSFKLISKSNDEYTSAYMITRLQIINDNLYFLQEDDSFDIGLNKFNSNTGTFNNFE